MSREGGEDAVDAGDGPVAIFVYGILKGGRLREYGCMRPEPATVDGYTLYSVHEMYPAAVPTMVDMRVRGELWLLPEDEGMCREALRTLDGIEGVPFLYTREVVQTSRGEAWMYVWAGSTEGLRWAGALWPHFS